MMTRLLHWHSLKTRVTFFTLVVFVVSLWGLSLMTSRMLRSDMYHTVSQQQASAVSLLAQFISHGLDDRLTALQRIAQQLTTADMAQPAALQKHLSDHMVFQELFSGGAFVVGRDGLAIADTQMPAKRLNQSFANQSHISQAMQENRPVIGPVGMDPATGSQFGMAAPIHNNQGAVIGAVVGITDLNQPNFLDLISDSHYGQTGGYLLLDPQQHQVLAASDLSRSYAKTSATGLTPALDPLLQASEISLVFKNSQGLELLASNRHIAPTGWTLLVLLPTDEAFAPIRDMERRTLIATVVLTLAAGLLTWWLLSRLLTPVMSTIRALAQRSNSDVFAPLESIGQGELGVLVDGFNAQMAKTAEQQASLEREHAMLARTEAVAHLGSWQWELTSDKFTWSEELFRIFQLEAASTAPSFAEQQKLFLSPDLLRWRDAVADAIAHHRPYELELTVLRPDSSQRFCVVRGEVELDANHNVQMLYGSLQDVTETRQAQLRLRLAGKVFDFAHEGITITDAQGTILEVNESFCRITGYGRDEVIGQNFRLLKSGRHEANFYTAMWQTLLAEGLWTGEIWNRRKSGEIYPEVLNISAVRDAQGVTQQYVALFSDITRRKEMEERVHQMAFFDPLTNLPNRRLLADRLSQTLMSNRRSGRYAALMFLDLDNFKPLNDRHGHATGDLLLMEVAKRLKSSVREMDTVARIGGDEFVVMLSELDMAADTSTEQASAVAEKIRLSLDAVYVLDSVDKSAKHHVEHHCGVSIGVVLIEPETTDADAKLAQADSAMYRAKELGRNQVVFSPLEPKQ
jgi:diguanylate cyclase (GGDEF)-like protein/PAS domain S-box-containing protein